LLCGTIKQMRRKLVIPVLLWLVSSPLVIAGQPKPRYTTLVVEYAGEQDRYTPPVVISTSSEEGEWYRQHLWPEPWGELVFIEVMPASVLNEITELPLLKCQLISGDDEPKTLMDVSFTVGVGHDHVQKIVDDQTSTKILKDIAEVIAKYSDLKGELEEI